MDRDRSFLRAIFMVLAIGSIAAVISLPTVYWYLRYLEATQKDFDQNSNAHNNKVDRFTNCIQIVMQEARASGRGIDPEKAKDICVHAKKSTSPHSCHPAKIENK